MKELSRERKKRWINAVSRDGLTDAILTTERVCQRHFVSGRAAKSWDKYNVDWVPNLNLGQTKRRRDREDLVAIEKRDKRTKKRERSCKIREQRGKEIEAENAIKMENIKEGGKQVADLDFNEACEGDNYSDRNSVEDTTQTDEFDYPYRERKSCSVRS